MKLLVCDYISQVYRVRRLSKEVEDEEMEYYRAQHVVGEGAFGGYFFEFIFILGVDLGPQRSSQHELTNGAREPSQERVEGEIGDQHTVCELHNAREHEEEQERVNELEAVRCLVVVRLPQRLDDCRLRWRRRLRFGHYTARFCMQNAIQR